MHNRNTGWDKVLQIPQIVTTAFLAAVFLHAGCGKEPERFRIEYRGFAFSPTPELSYDRFSVHIMFGAVEAPPLRIRLANGTEFNTRDLTEAWVEKYREAHPNEYITFSERGGPDVPLYEDVKVHIYDGENFEVRFDNGKLYSFYLSSRGAVATENGDDWVTLPSTEAEILAVFGEPAKRTRIVR